MLEFGKKWRLLEMEFRALGKRRGLCDGGDAAAAAVEAAAAAAADGGVGVDDVARSGVADSGLYTGFDVTGSADGLDDANEAADS